MIDIQTVGFSLSNSQKNNPKWIILKQVADKDLAGFKKYLTNVIVNELNFSLTDDIHLIVSIKSNLEFKIDYSLIKKQSQGRLIKQYLETTRMRNLAILDLS